MAEEAVVTTWTEADLAVRMGATPAQAAAAVATVVDLGLLPHGVAVVAAVAGSRWGIPPGEALAALADGRQLRGAPSDYELRTGAEEAEDELSELMPVPAEVTQGEVWSAAGLVHAQAVASAYHRRPR